VRVSEARSRNQAIRTTGDSKSQKDDQHFRERDNNWRGFCLNFITWDNNWRFFQFYNMGHRDCRWFNFWGVAHRKKCQWPQHRNLDLCRTRMLKKTGEFFSAGLNPVLWSEERLCWAL
jgi:hypothetical protein